jgi:flagellar hook assembly protein FlgD
VGSGPLSTGLSAARPNPFRGATQFEFTLARAARVELAVFDVMGRAVRHLAPAHDWPAGVHALAWDGRRDDGSPAGPGLYFARLRVDGASHMRTVVKLDR